MIESEDNPNEQQQEYEKDLLLRLLAPRALEQLDVTDPANARFLEWLAREARAQAGRLERRRLSVMAHDFARRALDRAAIASTTVRKVDTQPVAERQHEVGSLAVSIDRAAKMRMAPRLEPAVAAGAGREIWDEPCDVWVRVPDELPDGRYLALPVAGDSMTPLFHAGDLLLVRLGSEYRTGDVVVARHADGGYVVKRAGLVRPDVVELMSLNTAYPPMRVPRDELSVLGTVLLRWSSHRDRGIPRPT